MIVNFCFQYQNPLNYQEFKKKKNFVLLINISKTNRDRIHIISKILNIDLINLLIKQTKKIAYLFFFKSFNK